MWDTELESTTLLGELVFGRGVSGLPFPVLVSISAAEGRQVRNSEVFKRTSRKLQVNCKKSVLGH